MFYNFLLYLLFLILILFIHIKILVFLYFYKIVCLIFFLYFKRLFFYVLKVYFLKSIKKKKIKYTLIVGAIIFGSYDIWGRDGIIPDIMDNHELICLVCENNPCICFHNSLHPSGVCDCPDLGLGNHHCFRALKKSNKFHPSGCLCICHTNLTPGICQTCFHLN